MAKEGNGPKALVMQEVEAIIAVGCIIGEIPAVDLIDIDKIETGMQLSVDADNGTVEIK